MNTDYLIHLVKTYFSTVFFLWVIGNILLRVLVTKKRIKKRKKKKGGGIGNIFYDIWCFLLKLFTLGHYGCGHKVDVEYEYFFRKRWSPSSPMETV
jgi:hypothetical protein|tara:strand:- start:48 stop:335 length:288 start_codon:yes stop_codon:yes gene_type:complete